MGQQLLRGALEVGVSWACPEAQWHRAPDAGAWLLRPPAAVPWAALLDWRLLFSMQILA